MPVQDSDLHSAAAAGDTEAVKALLSHGVNVNKQDKEVSLVKIATDCSAIQTSQHYCRHVWILKNNCRLLHLLYSPLQRCKQTYIVTIEVLRLSVLQGDTALRRAVDNAHVMAVEVLLKAGANANISNNKVCFVTLQTCAFMPSEHPC